jgi:hypothetical protein
MARSPRDIAADLSRAAAALGPQSRAGRLREAARALGPAQRPGPNEQPTISWSRVPGQPGTKPYGIAEPDVKMPGGRLSQAVASLGYDYKTKELYVTYQGKEGKKGGSYIYHNVPNKVYVEFATASSKGWFVNRRIKGTYGFTRQ